MAVDVDYLPTEQEVAEREGEKPAGPEPSITFTAPTFTQEVAAPLVPPLVLGLIAFAVVGLIIWAGKRVTSAAGGVAKNMTARATGDNNTDRHVISPALPGAPYAAYKAPVTVGVTAAPPAPRPVAIANIHSPFLGEAERALAKQSLDPLHVLLTALQRADSGPLWNADGGIATRPDALPANPTGASVAPGGVAPVTLPAPGGMAQSTRAATFSGTGGPARTGNPVSPEGAAQRQMHATALATATSLVTHNEQFPAPLRPAVRAFAHEVRGYLKDAEVAAGSADDRDRADVRAGASRRLARANALLQYMDAMASGSTDPRQTPMP